MKPEKLQCRFTISDYLSAENCIEEGKLNSHLFLKVAVNTDVAEKSNYHSDKSYKRVIEVTAFIGMSAVLTCLLDSNCVKAAACLNTL